MFTQSLRQNKPIDKKTRCKERYGFLDRNCWFKISSNSMCIINQQFWNVSISIYYAGIIYVFADDSRNYCTL